MAFLMVYLVFVSYLFWSFLSPAYGGSHGFFYASAGILSLLFGAQLWLILVFFRSKIEDELRFEKPLLNAAFISMGITSFLFTFTLLRDLAALPFRYSSHSNAFYTPASTGWIALISACFFGAGVYRARTITRSPLVPIDLDGKAPGLAGIKIAHLSDLHLGGGPSLSQIKKAIDLTLQSKPDLIVLTGDIIDGDIRGLKQELQELSRLKARLGAYFVIGNHECYWNAEECSKTIATLGIQPLLNEGRMIGSAKPGIWIAGVADPAHRMFGGAPPLIPEPPTDAAFKILLSHQPVNSEKASAMGYDLLLSGHTHGGQFFPWNLLVKRIYRHSGGLSRSGAMKIYVSRGSGFWGPPVRLGTDSEVATLVLTGT
jgi:predicted MPP superfamily phosphohydrolase